MRNADRQRSREQHSARVLRSQRIARSVLGAISPTAHRNGLDHYHEILESIDRPKTADELAQAESIVSTPPRSRQGKLL